MSITIPREKFSAAIEAGICEGRQNGLTDKAVNELRRVGREATSVGRTFRQNFPGDPCCPATQAGLSHKVEAVRWFAFAYDDAIYPTLKPYGFRGLANEAAKIA